MSFIPYFQGFICCICKDGEIWDNWKKLKTHYYKFHLSRDTKKLVRCSKCKRTFATLSTYHTHMEKFHSGVKKSKSLDDEDFEPNKKKAKKSLSTDEPPSEIMDPGEGTSRQVRGCSKIS